MLSNECHGCDCVIVFVAGAYFNGGHGQTNVYYFEEFALLSTGSGDGVFACSLVRLRADLEGGREEYDHGQQSKRHIKGRFKVSVMQPFRCRCIVVSSAGSLSATATTATRICQQHKLL